MSLAEVYAEADSEDEVDKEVAAIEGIRNLNRFGGVTEHQKRMMHLWNTFKKEQRVLADGHMPWACEAFCTQHKEEFIQSPELLMYVSNPFLSSCK
ncbi:polycomb group protein EMF2B-like isoform X2 [Bidens hawaiensis]